MIVTKTKNDTLKNYIAHHTLPDMVWSAYYILKTIDRCNSNSLQIITFTHPLTKEHSKMLFNEFTIPNNCKGHIYKVQCFRIQSIISIV